MKNTVNQYDNNKHKRMVMFQEDMLDCMQFPEKVSNASYFGNYAEFECGTSLGGALYVYILFYSQGIFRVYTCNKRDLPQEREWFLEAKPAGSGIYTWHEERNSYILNTEDVRIVVGKASWRFEIYDRNGSLITRQVRERTVSGELEVAPMGFGRSGSFNCDVYTEALEMSPDEHFFGFGERFEEIDKRGKRICTLVQDTLCTVPERNYKPVPFFISSRGYGIYVNTLSPVSFDMGVASYTSYSFRMVDNALDYFFIYGPEMKDVITRYCSLCGFPYKPPKWAFGYWQSSAVIRMDEEKKERMIGYTSEEQVKEVVERLRSEGISCDVVHLDPGWCEGNKGWGHISFDYRFNQETFPDPKGMMEWLKERGIRVSVWEWPYVNPQQLIHKELNEKGYLTRNKDLIEGDNAFFMGGQHVAVDFTNPEAVEWYKNMHKELVRLGVAVFKTDFGEEAPYEAEYYNGEAGYKMHQLYPYLYQKTVAEAMAEEGAEPVLWGRAGYSGCHRFSIHWGGDNDSTFHAMAGVLRAGLNAGLSCYAFWSHDAGGFSHLVDKTFEEASPELYVRWCQFGMLSPHVRCHGGSPREPWHFGEEVLRIFKKYNKLRYRLLPYIYTFAHEAAKTGWPVMRPMCLEFPQDPVNYHIDLQYMFGDAILVAPMFEEKGSRNIYLPEGVWTDYWTKKEYTGGRYISCYADLDIMPLFIRQDSIIPMGPEIEYVGQRVPDMLELDIYLKSRVYFRLEDDGYTAEFEGEIVENGVKFIITASNTAYILNFNSLTGVSEVNINNRRLAMISPVENFENCSCDGWFERNGSLVVMVKESGFIWVSLK